MLLAIDTATKVMSIALHNGQTLLSEQSWYTENRHSIELSPAVAAMLRVCAITVKDLSAVAVSIGPGSYTGLRIGVSLAKGIAAPRNLPVVGITTLDTLAAGQPFYQSGTGLIVVVQAGRGRLIVKTYRRNKGRWQSRTEPRLMDWQTLLETMDGPAHITGEIDSEGLAILTEAQSRDVPITLAPPAHRLRRAGFLAEDAWDMLREAGEDKSAFSAEKLLPVYIKSDNDES
ncbi:MAG: tRNA (adenosine(37)-N6)-threonylcarbamoyltransferase complex dimerization subunit type 1 TsaB [Anaerolineae bacterium]